MMKKYYKVLLIISSFSFLGVILFITFKLFLPVKDLPVIYPDNEKIFIEIDFKKNKKDLEIYNIIEPNTQHNDSDNVSKKIIPSIKENLSNQLTLDKNEFRLQLGSVRNKSKTKQIYKNFKKKFPKYFLSEYPLIEKVVIKDKGTFYRIKSFESYSKEEAKKICKKLLSEKFDCLISKRNSI